MHNLRFLCSGARRAASRSRSEIENPRRCLGRWYKSCAATVVKQRAACAVVAEGPVDKGEYRTELSLKTSAATVDQTRERRKRRGAACVIPRIALQMKVLCLSMRGRSPSEIFSSINVMFNRACIVAVVPFPQVYFATVISLYRHSQCFSEIVSQIPLFKLYTLSCDCITACIAVSSSLTRANAQRI